MALSEHQHSQASMAVPLLKIPVCVVSGSSFVCLLMCATVARTLPSVAMSPQTPSTPGGGEEQLLCGWSSHSATTKTTGSGKCSRQLAERVCL